MKKDKFSVSCDQGESDCFLLSLNSVSRYFLLQKEVKSRSHQDGLLQLQEDLCRAHEQGLHGHRAVQDPEEDPDRDPQTLQDLQDPQFLHEKSQIHPNKLLRETNPYIARISQVGRHSSFLC